MKEIYQIFTESPFKYLKEHMDQVKLCIQELLPMTEAFVEGSFDEIKEYADRIHKAENQADLVKHRIREHLPKNIFMPVAREDVLKLLHRQDNLADSAQDLAFLISVRNTAIISELKEDIISFVKSNVLPANRVIELTENMQNLMETSFSGPKAKAVLELIETICKLESESDAAKFRLMQKVFELESMMDPICVVLLLKILDCMSSVADSAQKVANTYRLMVSK